MKIKYNYAISGISKSGHCSTTADIKHYDGNFIPERLDIYKNGMYWKSIDLVVEKKSTLFIHQMADKIGEIITKLNKK